MKTRKENDQDDSSAFDLRAEYLFPHRANLPTRFHELNIHFGVWLGGLAGFNEIFLGNLPSFRGCMSHITYSKCQSFECGSEKGFSNFVINYFRQ